MPLVIGVPLEKDFFVMDERFVIIDVPSEKSFKIKHIGEHMDRIFEINDLCSVQVLPEVKISSGPNCIRGEIARVLIDAPRHINVARGNVYRRMHRDKVIN